MKPDKPLVIAKIIAVIGFLILLICVYGLRSEVLKLNAIRFSAEQERSAYAAQKYRDSHAQRMAQYQLQLEQHEMATRHYEREMAHYDRLAELSETDFEEYTRIAQEEALRFPTLPRVPYLPTPPDPPEHRDRLIEINEQFAAQRHHYFEMTSRMNWLACLGALMLVGGLLYLLMFDSNSARLYYFLTLVLSFVFLIGPAFHSILSGIVGFMNPPPM